jgi:hypothetical protein
MAATKKKPQPTITKKPAAKPKPAAKKPVAKPGAKPAKKPVAKPAPAKKPAAKPAKKPAAKPAKKPAAKPAKKPVAKPANNGPAFTIGITPPELAQATEAERFDLSVRSPKTRPTGTALTKAPWLAQDKAFRVGFYLLTHGLAAHGHPEIEMCNVPGALLEAATALLDHLGSYVVDDGAKLASGEAMMVSEDPLAVIGFERVPPGKGGTAHDVDVLRVVFLRLVSWWHPLYGYTRRA